MDLITIDKFAELKLTEKPDLVLSTMTSPRDFLTITMPPVVTNRAADDKMLATMQQLGWTVMGVINRVAYLSRPHVWKDQPTGWPTGKVQG